MNPASATVPVEGDFERGVYPGRSLRYTRSPSPGVPARFDLVEGDTAIATIDVGEGERRTDAIHALLAPYDPPSDTQIGIMWGRLGERLDRFSNVEVHRA